MISIANLKTVLQLLGFSQHETVYEKHFPQFSYSLKVDFSAKRLIYPDSIDPLRWAPIWMGTQVRTRTPELHQKKSSRKAAFFNEAALREG